MSETALAPAWIPASDTHQLALIDGKLACRNAKGTRLKTVPKAVRETETAAGLLALRDQLQRHEAACRAQVGEWMTGSLTVPVALIAACWPDESWAAPLTNLVVVAGEDRGLLRGVDEAGRAGIVDLDGETRWLASEAVRIPHPIDIPDLAAFQELLAEIGGTQGVAQLSRQVFPKPGGIGPGVMSIGEFSDGHFEELRHATSRAASSGFQVRGGYAVCRVLDGGKPLQARFWIGSDAPDYETWTGDLIWVDASERPVPVATLSPVAYSEGVRMASLIYAGRKVGEDE